MLVQALAKYAEKYLEEEMGDLAFEERPVGLSIELDEKGKFLVVVERIDEKVLGKKKVSVARPLVVPKSPVNRNSGFHPLLGCDAIQYVAGLDPAWTTKSDQQKHTGQHETFVELIKRAANETKDDALKACAKFYANEAQVAKARASLASRKLNLGALAVLSVRSDGDEPGGPIVSRPAVKEFWRAHYEQRFAERNAEGGEAMCLISGKVGPIAVTHDKIKGLANLGGQPAGVALMSFDKDAFRSYGWDKNANSPVSPKYATAYVLAFNDLLRLGAHRRGRSRNVVLPTRTDHAGIGFLYWTRDPEDLNPLALVEDADQAEVERLLLAVHTGKKESVDVAADNAFYLLAVSGNGGRLAVRDWFAESLTVTKANLGKWFCDLQIADVFNGGATSRPPKMWELLAALSPPRVKSDDPVNAERSMQMLRRALYGRPLGRTVLAAALARVRVAKDGDRFNTARMGLIRMCVNDIADGKGELSMTEALNDNERHPAYICGRLLAVYDELQYAAQGEINVTAVDRYYSLASTFPELALPKLQRLSIAHLKKLRRENLGAAIAIDRKLSELNELLVPYGARYPAQLNLEEQGRFTIGFHHQKALSQARIQESRRNRASADQK